MFLVSYNLRSLLNFRLWRSPNHWGLDCPCLWDMSPLGFDDVLKNSLLEMRLELPIGHALGGTSSGDVISESKVATPCWIAWCLGVWPASTAQSTCWATSSRAWILG